MHRRAFLSVAAAGILSEVAAAGPRETDTILDTHTHFYDPTRPQGVPWPGKDDKILYRRVLPDEFQKLTQPYGVTGTIVVEASPLVDDNQWLLDLAAKNRVIVGIVGNVDPLSEDFARNLRRFARNRLYRGIRINHSVLQKSLDQRSFQQAMDLLGELELEVDVNGGPGMPADVGRLARQFPDLRIVINHAANQRIDGKPPPNAWLKGMRDAVRGRHVMCKVSALVESTGKEGAAPRDTAFYRPVLDALWDAFGENRLLYGSNWPVSERYADYATLIGIVKDFFRAKGRTAYEKFFWRNAQVAYRVKM